MSSKVKQDQAEAVALDVDADVDALDVDADVDALDVDADVDALDDKDTKMPQQYKLKAFVSHVAKKLDGGYVSIPASEVNQPFERLENGILEMPFMQVKEQPKIAVHENWCIKV